MTSIAASFLVVKFCLTGHSLVRCGCILQSFLAFLRLDAKIEAFKSTLNGRLRFVNSLGGLKVLAVKRNLPNFFLHRHQMSSNDTFSINGSILAKRGLLGGLAHLTRENHGRRLFVFDFFNCWRLILRVLVKAIPSEIVKVLLFSTQIVHYFILLLYGWRNVS